MSRTINVAGFRRLTGAALLVAPLGLPLMVQAQQQPQQQQQQQQQSGTSSSPTASEAAATENYWTPERLRSAQPPQLPSPSSPGPQGMPQGAQIQGPELTRRPGQTEQGEGSPPSVDPGESLRRPLGFETGQQPSTQGGDATEATSSFGAFFTTSRVIPDAATVVFPYRAAGKLFFRDPRTNRNFVCSASVLRPRIVVTAGHCVTQPSTDAAQRYFFTNFLFVPAFNTGAAPIGSWTSSQQWVLNAWHLSNGSVPNPGDVAFLVMNDQSVAGHTQRIGSVTGWLGWRTQALAQNHVTMLGYPCNLDSCARMQVTNAGSFADGGSNTFIYGSAMRGGASGGPWVQDFGVAATGSPAATLGLNYLVAVTSYGPVAEEPKYLGASILNSNFVNVLNSACAASAGNC
jgi:V8-like Glu-specific endopeptidase